MTAIFKKQNCYTKRGMQTKTQLNVLGAKMKAQYIAGS